MTRLLGGPGQVGVNGHAVSYNAVTGVIGCQRCNDTSDGNPSTWLREHTGASMDRFIADRLGLPAPKSRRRT